MGRRGPVPKSLRQKLLEGNPGKRPLKKSRAPWAPKASCPTWLTPEAKTEWRRVAREVERMGLLTTLDRVGFAGYCENYARWEQCIRFLQEHGNCYLAPNGRLKGWPQVEMAKQACLSLRAFAAEFGLTPNSRLRLNVEGQEVEEDDPFERFLNGRR